MMDVRVGPRASRGMVALLCILTTGAAASPDNRHEHSAPTPPRILPNDNRSPAGRNHANDVNVVLTARTGRWFPDGDRRPAALTVAAFAEGDGTPSIPGPLIRVRAGTHLRITIRNALDGNFAGKRLVVHGLNARPTASDTLHAGVIRLAAGAEQTVEFDAGKPGTYHYWAAFSDTTINGRKRHDAGLSGALVVDPANGPIPHDRIFVMSRMVLPAEGEGAEHQPDRFATTINGLSWPLTERIDAAVADTIHWRWINATSASHPMHLHGFFYHVDALGDERADTLYQANERPLVVTQRMAPGATMSMTWVPERGGNWLMHCHLQVHTGPDDGWGFPDVPGTPPFGLSREKTPPHAQHEHDMARDMAGLLIGIRVHAAPTSSTSNVGLTATATPRHDVRLTILGRVPGEDGVGQMATIIEDTAAPGGGGPSGGTSPMIATGASFDALMTPPRSGTFIYHAHTLRTSQLAAGLYGPLLVFEPNESYDPTSEVILMVGGPTVDSTHTLFLNGAHAPPPMTLSVGRRYRVRVFNIGETMAGDLVVLDGDGAEAKPVTWRATAKDAIPLPAARAITQAAKFRANVGETFDFEFTPERAGVMRVELRYAGKLMASQKVAVR